MLSFRRQNVFILGLLITLAFPQGLFAQILDTEKTIFNPHVLALDDQLLDVYSMSEVELALILSRGSLAQYSAPDVFGVVRPAQQLIWNAAQEFQINPRFLVVLLQREQSLIEDDHPTQDQLDWAMGYAVCDDCEKSDPQLQKFKGFGNQVYYAAKRIRESYLKDLLSRGFTETGVGPGIEIAIDGTSVIPANFATSVLYTYTPHLLGNKNFVRIWSDWFNVSHLDGSLLQDQTSGGIWLIQSQVRRPITSKAAFLSRFNERNVIQVGPSVLASYPIGSPIQFPNYSLLRSPGGTVYLIVDDTRRGFTSQEAIRSIGYSTDEIIDVNWDELKSYQESEPITTQSVYPQGVLLQDKKTGGVYFVRNGLKHPIMSREILFANFLDPTIVPRDSQDLQSYQTSEPLPFRDGTLIGVRGSPDVFIVSHGVRRPIVDEATFIFSGWNWNQIIWTDERSVLVQPLGEPLQILTDPEPNVVLTTTSF